MIISHNIIIISLALACSPVTSAFTTLFPSRTRISFVPLCLSRTSANIISRTLRRHTLRRSMEKRSTLHLLTLRRSPGSGLRSHLLTSSDPTSPKPASLPVTTPKLRKMKLGIVQNHEPSERVYIASILPFVIALMTYYSPFDLP